MTEYPNYARWLALLAQRNAGVLFVVVTAVISVLILAECRFLFPRFFPAARASLSVGFLILLVVSLIGAVL